MNNTVFKDFPDDSRVWLYQTNRPLAEDEMKLINNKMNSFIKEWAAHGNQLWGNATVLNPYFVLIAVNDKLTPPSGCSIDASVHKLKEIGQLLNIDFFTRMKVTYQKDDTLKQIDFNELTNIANTDDILILDPLIHTLGELRNEWPRKLSDSSFAAIAHN